MRFDIHNKKTVSFWSDDSLDMGKLWDITCDLETRYLGVVDSATLADIAGESSWKI